MAVLKSTTTMVKSDHKALGHYGLTMTLMVDHDPYELTMIVVNLPRVLPNC